MIEAMKLALEALENNPYALAYSKVITSLRQAIEQAEKQQALDKKAENARELGLDYEPVPWIENMTIDSTNELSKPTAPVQEPYGWVSQHTVKGPYEWQFNKELSGVYRDNAISILPVYTTPQSQREWVGLTNDERVELMQKVPHLTIGGLLAVEAKLKERNHVN